MARSVFSRDTILATVRPSDQIRFKVDLQTDREEVIAAAIAQSELYSGDHPPFARIVVRGKTCVFHKDYSTHLIYRTIAGHIARRFRVRPLSRDTIIKGVLEALADTTPMWVVRRDISSFYESIPIQVLQERLLYDTAIPSSIRGHLRSLFKTHCEDHRGLPRGVGLAAILAEMAMNDFDREVRAIHGVYRYFRFSDDILIFSFSEPATLVRALDEQVVRMGMKFNERKSSEISICARQKADVKKTSFEYLGYRFSFEDAVGQNQPRPVVVSIGSRKIDKIKSRVILALKDFRKNKDYELLYDRMRYVSSNFIIPRPKSQKHVSSGIKSGIYYNYRLCGLYKGSRSQDHDCAELKALDAFYHAMIKGSGSKFRATLTAELGAAQIKKLREISFYKGYASRYMLAIDMTRVSALKTVWNNAKY